ALVLRHARIGAQHDHAEVGEVRARGPDLLAIDDPVIAVAHGARAHRRHIRPRRRLGEELAPDLLTAECRADITLLLLLGGVGEPRRDAHAEAALVDAARHDVARLFLVVDHLLHLRAALAAIFDRHGDPGEAGLVLLRLPFAGERDEVVVTVFRGRRAGLALL